MIIFLLMMMTDILTILKNIYIFIIIVLIIQVHYYW